MSLSAEKSWLKTFVCHQFVISPSNFHILFPIDLMSYVCVREGGKNLWTIWPDTEASESFTFFERVKE